MTSDTSPEPDEPTAPDPAQPESSPAEASERAPEAPAVEPPRSEPTPAAEPQPSGPALEPGPGAITRFVAVGLILLSALGIGLYFRGSGGGAPQAETPQGAPPATPVQVVVVGREDLAYEPRFLGQTSASQTVEVRSRVSGYITQSSFTEGGVVEPGQLLFQIDPRPFELELGQARAQLAAAEARRDRATQQVKRYRVLSAKQAATQGELEEWEKEERVAIAEVELQAVRIAGAELQLDYASIEAPVKGVIGEELLDVGTHVGGPGDLLAVIERLDPLHVRYAVTEQELLHWQRQRDAAQLEQPDLQQLELQVTLADGRVHPHTGRIDFIESGFEQGVGATTVRGVIPNPDRSLRPGQFVHVSVLGMRRLGLIRVPQKAVLHSPAGASVYVVGEGNTVEARPVELGEWEGAGQWEITAGLEPGDRVIVNRVLTLRPGAPVVPSEAGADPPPSPPTPESPGGE